MEKSGSELHLIEKGRPGGGTDPENENLSDLEVEASIAADRILQLVGTEIMMPGWGAYRKAEYRIWWFCSEAPGQGNRVSGGICRPWIPAYADINTGYLRPWK